MQKQTGIYALAEEFVQQTACPIFLTGKAGTGKTTFLKHIREHTQKQMAVVAPTGVAAINAGGVTIHSFFQLPFTPFAPIPEGRKNLISKSKISSMRRKVLQELELLVIDEISMVRADLLDAIDTMLRHFRYRPNEPFGGVQMVYIGDMYQLSPVVPNEEWQLLSQFYEGPYFFQSKAIQEQPPVFIELDHIFRQTNEQFITLLNEVRNDRITEASRSLLNSRHIPNFRPNNKDGYITLTTHNAKADRINNEELAKIKAETFYFDAQIQGDFPEKSYPNEMRLGLKKGARVMFIANDTETPRRYYNGKIGVIADIEDDQIWVDCEDDTSIEVKRETWENIHYAINKESNQIEENKLGSYTQYPLRLAWAITIHKSQGLTFDKVVIDAEAAFTSGQVYVALSRCRSLEGIVLSSPINEQALHVNGQITQYASQKKATQELQQQISIFKEQYNERVLLSIFDLNGILDELRTLHKETNDVKDEFNSETLPFIDASIRAVGALSDIMASFRNQIKQLCLRAEDKPQLATRIAAAVDYFAPRLSALVTSLEQSPAVTDSRANARAYSELLNSTITHLAYKKYLIEGIRNDFSVTHYFTVKAKFTIPKTTINAYAGSKKEIQSNTEHKDLFLQLVALRKELCEGTNAPVFLIASTKTLNALCELLPQTPDELMKIKGFGKIKTQKYGDRFLEIINSYCHQHGLNSQIEFESSKTNRVVKKDRTEPKKPKTNSALLSFEMFQQGKSIEDIAAARGYTVSTIERHLCRYIANGMLFLSDFVAPDIVTKVVPLLVKGETLSAIYHHFEGKISYGQLRMIQASMERKNN